MTPGTGARTILIATGNPGKACEITAVLSEPISGSVATADIRWIMLANLDVIPSEPEEDGATFAENAALKARYYSRCSGLWTLADDSGLEVDALGGEPGILSARYAGLPEHLTRAERDAANNKKLMERLRGIPQPERTARFRCALALADGDRILARAEGAVEGRIIDEPRGTNGFGYDPYFLVPELGQTTAELAAEHKNRISHRGQALRRMREALKKLSP